MKLLKAADVLQELLKKITPVRFYSILFNGSILLICLLAGIIEVKSSYNRRCGWRKRAECSDWSIHKVRQRDDDSDRSRGSSQSRCVNTSSHDSTSL